jgi:hypothetical protein
MFFRHFNNLSHISTFESYLNNIHHLVCISIVAMHVDRHFMHVEISIISWVPTSTKVTKCTTEEAHGVVGNS